MAKRFTDTEKWKKSFFKGLQAPYKIVWLYLLDDCNHAGVWEVEFDVLKIRTGINTSINEILSVFGEKIRVFDDGNKWFIRDFIEFQYGELNDKNRAHNSVLQLLISYKNKGLISPLKGAKDKDKDKDKDNKFDTFWDLYDKKIGDKKKLIKKWDSLKDTERELILKYIPRYIKSQPDKQYRKNPETFFNNRGWEDEILSNEQLESKTVKINLG